MFVCMAYGRYEKEKKYIECFTGNVYLYFDKLLLTLILDIFVFDAEIFCIILFCCLYPSSRWHGNDVADVGRCATQVQKDGNNMAGRR